MILITGFAIMKARMMQIKTSGIRYVALYTRLATGAVSQNMIPASVAERARPRAAMTMAT